MNKKIKWGIIGLGKIAGEFAADLQLSTNAVLYGVASRDIERAKNFSQRYHSLQFYGSYEELITDPEIDIVYISTPHSFHFEHTMMCLKKGKSVLCEKPMGMNTGEVEKMIDEAKSRNLFLMEGMWTRFIPATQKVIDLLQKRVIGDVNIVRADFGFRGDQNPEKRLFNKKLGGGSLLDIGIYPIYLSLITLGIPGEIQAMGRLTNTFVDSFCAMLFSYPGGAKAILESSFESDTPTEGYIYGNKGSIKLHSKFHHSEKISLFQNGTLKKEFELPQTGNGLFHEIEEVNQCLLNNKTESFKLPLDTSIDLISIIDRVRDQIGLTYDSL